MPESIKQSEVMKEIKTPEEEEFPTSLEIAKTADLEKVSGGISEIQEAIDHDQPVTAEAVDNLSEALANLTVRVGGVNIPMKELRVAKDIPDFKKNTKIWSDIEAGNIQNDTDNYRDLTFLPEGIARVLILEFNKNLPHSRINGLYFDGLITLSEDTATQLARFKGRTLSFGSSLSTLGNEIIKELAKFKGTTLSFSGLNHLGSKAAKELSGFGGDFLILNGLETLDKETASQLAGFGGKSISLNGIYDIDDDVSKELARFNGSYDAIHINASIKKAK